MENIKATLKIAFPIILGQLGFTLLGFIDNIMVGKLGASALAAISLSNSFIFIGLAIGIGFSIMITPLVSMSLGEKNEDRVSKLFYNGVLLCTLLGIMLFIILWYSKYIIQNSKQPEEVVALAVPYLQIVSLSIIPSMIFQGLKQFMDGLSKTKYSMYCIIIANLINVFLNYVLIFGAFGFPELGVYGAGLGTFISRIIMLLMALIFVINIESIKVHIKKMHWRVLNLNTILDVTKTGTFSSIQILFKISLFSAAIILSGLLGKEVQASNQIVLSLSGILFVIPLGIATASSIRISNLIGAKKKRKIQQVIWSSLKIILILEVIFFLVLYTGKELFPKIYIDDINVIAVAAKAIIFLAIFHFFDGIEVVLLGFLKGFNDTKVPAFLCFMSYWVVGFSISYYSFETYGILGIWAGLIAGVACSTVVLFIRSQKVYTAILKEERYTHSSILYK